MIINMNGAKAPETPSPVLQEKTVTPETLPTVIGADEGYDGLSQVTVNPDAQLKAENIRSGKTVFGVEGSFVGEPYEVENSSSRFLANLPSFGGTYDPGDTPIVIGRMLSGMIQGMSPTKKITFKHPNPGGMLILDKQCCSISSDYPIEIIDSWVYVPTTNSYNSDYNFSGRLAYPVSYTHKPGDSAPAPRYNAMFSNPRIVLPAEEFFGTGSFYNCYYTPDRGNTAGILTIVFPPETKYIHAKAVYGNETYQNIVEFTSPTPPSGLVEKECFVNVSKIIVPAGSLTAYQNVFTEYTNIIEEKSE